MKNIIFLLLLVSGILSNTLQAQYITLPDTNFVNYLVANHPSCMVGGQLDTACAKLYNVSAMVMSNKNIYDITGIEYFIRLQGITCNSNYISMVGKLPPNLTNINCSRNLIENFESFPSTLTQIICPDNDLDTLPALPPGLLFLNFTNNNNFTAVPLLPNTLTRLECANNPILNFPVLPGGLLHLNIAGTLITSIPPLPTGLIYLYVNNLDITTLPTLPNTLREAQFSYCNLTALPNLPDSLRRLGCANNDLTSLPQFPDSLTFIDCNYNPLTGLPSTLPPTLETLYVGFCPINELPPLPSTLTDLYCPSANLSELPELPPYMRELTVSGNPISCLPQLKKIDYFDFRYTNITCLPNYGQVTTSYPSLSTVPLCNFFNTNGCDVFYNITGKTYFDDNANCSFDLGDVNLRNAKVQLFKNGQLLQQAFTGGEGYYTFDVQNAPGTYTTSIDSSNLPFTISCPDTGYYKSILTTTDTLFFNKDFGLKCKQGFDIGAYDVIRDLLRIFRPASTHTINVVAGDIAKFYGASCANVAGQVTVVISGPATALSYPGLAPTTISGNTIVWDIADFGAISLFNSFLIETQVDTFAQAGNLVCFDVSVTPTVGDNNPSNNQLTHCYVVVNAYDPNNKEVYPAGNIDTAVHWLTYTVNFQNTGNAPAEHIYLLDTLDSNLDESSIQLLTYSHDNYTQVLPGGIVKFNFPNINLPDSLSNEPQSHGYVRYKIKMKDNLPIGTVIENTAHIYFDFNPAIVTNTTLNTLIAQVSKPLVSASQSSACMGDTITLQTDANALYTYQWLRNGNNIPNAVSTVLKAVQSGNYTVSITDGNSANVSDVQMLTFNSLPAVSFTLPTDPFCKGAQPVDLAGYASPAGGTFAGTGIVGTSIDVSNVDAYTVIYSYTDGNGCSKTEQANLVVDECIGIAGIDGNEFRIYPNPASSAISITGTAIHNGYMVNVMDLNGKLLATQMLTGTETLVDIASLHQGVYVVTVLANDGQIVANHKLVVIR